MDRREMRTGRRRPSSRGMRAWRARAKHCSRSRRGRKSRKQRRLSERRQDRDLDGLAKLSVPCSRPQPLLCSHSKVRPEQHRGRGRAEAASLQCACGQDSSSATCGGPPHQGHPVGCAALQKLGEQWEDI
eukprot:1142310-Pelagomonas_calceolata.AAC.2